MEQLHKRFTTEQVKTLLKGCCLGTLDGPAIDEILEIGKSRFFALPRETSCHPNTCSYYQHKQCRRVMNLQFLIPDCPGFDVYQLDTSSFHPIVNINSSLKLIRAICQRISMIPLSLKLVEQVVQ